MLIPVWAKALAILLVLAAFFGAGYKTKDLLADKAAAEVQNELLASQLKDINKQLSLQAEGQERLEKSLSTIPRGSVIRDIVKNNPSNCAVAAPVASGLREQVDKARAARNASR